MEKISFNHFFQAGYQMQKEAGAPAEVVGSLVNPLNIPLNLPAGLLGLVIGEEDPKAFKNMSSISSLIVPGLGPYRLGKRLHYALDEMDRKRD
jgi:hypothetical protein